MGVNSFGRCVVVLRSQPGWLPWRWLEWEYFWGGGIRRSYSFFAIMLVYRSNFILTSRLGLVAMSVLLAIWFLIPFINSRKPVIDSAVVISTSHCWLHLVPVPT